MFHQVEGLVIDKGSHLGHLKWILEEFCKAFFEVDQVRCGSGRRSFRSRSPPSRSTSSAPATRARSGSARARTGSKILGCGMVHPNVLRNCGLDPDEYQGFAWGMGIDRIAMLKYGMPDLRAFFEAVHALARPLRLPPARSADPGRRVELVKFTLSWLKGASGDRRCARRDRGQAHHDRARGRARGGQGKALAPFTIARVDLRRAAPQCGSAARVHGRYRGGRAGAGRVWGAQRQVPA